MSIICFDTETTGLASDDEIIQLSIADANTGECILNEYFRPSDRLMERGWDEAAAVTGIYPEDVEDCASLDDPEVHAEIQSIFDNTEIVIGYHVAYDINMMERAGFDMSRVTYQDPMLAFAAYYWSTHPDEKYTSRSGNVKDPWMKWKNDGFGGKGQWMNRNLGFAHEFLLGYPLDGAHDSMNDVNGTIRVWDAMNQIQEDVYFRGFAYDEDGEPIYDDSGEAAYEDELGQPMIDPNGQAFVYVYDYTRDQLAEIDS